MIPFAKPRIREGKNLALFKNQQWEVTEYGLECRPPNAPYEIQASRLTETTERGGEWAVLYDWPVHMAEKTWVNVGSFVQAFSEALKHHTGKYDPPFDQVVFDKTLAYLRKYPRG